MATPQRVAAKQHSGQGHGEVDFPTPERWPKCWGEVPPFPVIEEPGLSSGEVLNKGGMADGKTLEKEVIAKHGSVDNLGPEDETIDIDGMTEEKECDETSDIDGMTEEKERDESNVAEPVCGVVPECTESAPSQNGAGTASGTPLLKDK